MFSQIFDSTAREDARLIGIDWGTTSCRAFLLDGRGRPIDERLDGRGTLALTDGGGDAFDAELVRLCADWSRDATLPMIACGMVGSAQGWIEAPYVAVPTSAQRGLGALTTVASTLGPLAIVPGLSAASHATGWADVLRGEETQLVGVAEADGDEDRRRLVVLPGTHSKWVRMRGASIDGFTTSMTGELFGLLTTSSTLARLAEPSEHFDADAFDEGARVAERVGLPRRSILSAAFSARSRRLLGELAASAVSDYLSGMLIADEVADHLEHELDAHVDEVIVVGADHLAQRYARALRARGIDPRIADPDTTALGLWRLACVARLVTKEHA